MFFFVTLEIYLNKRDYSLIRKLRLENLKLHPCHKLENTKKTKNKDENTALKNPTTEIQS